MISRDAEPLSTPWTDGLAVLAAAVLGGIAIAEVLVQPMAWPLAWVCVTTWYCLFQHPAWWCRILGLTAGVITLSLYHCRWMLWERSANANWHYTALFVAMSAVMLLFFGLILACTAKLPRYRVAWFLAGWIMLEQVLLLLRWPFWQLGLSQIGSLWVSQWASVGGVPLLSLIVLTSGILVGEGILRGRKLYPCISIMLFVSAYIGGYWILPGVSAEEGVVRVHFGRRLEDLPALPSNRPSVEHMTTIALVSEGGVLLSVDSTAEDWAKQGRCDRSVYASRPDLAEIVARFDAVALGTRVVVRCSESEPPPRFNACLIGSSRELLVHNKHTLVPFSEMLPPLLPSLWVASLGIEKPELRPGPSIPLAELHLNTGKVYCCSPICFEICFPLPGDFARLHGPKWILNVGNERSCRGLELQFQMLTLARFRAIENRATVIRCTQSGYTGVIDPWGRAMVHLSQSHNAADCSGDFPWVTPTGLDSGKRNEQVSQSMRPESPRK